MLHSKTVEPLTLAILNELMEKPYLNSFILVGGTGLSLQIGHRISMDLDLFTLDPFDTTELKDKLSSDFKSFQTVLERPNTLIYQPLILLRLILFDSNTDSTTL